MTTSLPRTMQALVNYRSTAGSVELREVPVPEPGPGEVLLRTRGVGICGSDLHQYHNTQSWAVNWPVTLGHEFCGEIVALGEGVEGWHIHDRVTCETAARVCGQCALCRSNQYHLCPQRLGFGYGIDGAAATYVAVRAPLLHRIPDELSWEEAAITEPCCVAGRVVLELSEVRPGDTVVVLGPGPVGLLATGFLAAASPANLVVAGLQKDALRLELARKYGANRTVMTDVEDVSEVVLSLGDGLGADLVIDATGVSAALRNALAIVRPGGQITKVGWGPQPLNFSLDPLVAKAVTLRGSFSHNWSTWERVLRLLEKRVLDVRPLIHCYPLEKWQEAFKQMEEGNIAKAVLIP
jgi:L-iditol 2-dehydrogenase